MNNMNNMNKETLEKIAEMINRQKNIITQRAVDIQDEIADIDYTSVTDLPNIEDLTYKMQQLERVFNEMNAKLEEIDELLQQQSTKGGKRRTRKTRKTRKTRRTRRKGGKR